MTTLNLQKQKINSEILKMIGMSVFTSNLTTINLSYLTFNPAIFQQISHSPYLHALDSIVLTNTSISLAALAPLMSTAKFTLSTIVTDK